MVFGPFLDAFPKADEPGFPIFKKSHFIGRHRKAVVYHFTFNVTTKAVVITVVHSRPAFVQVVGLLNAYLPLTVTILVFVINGSLWSSDGRRKSPGQRDRLAVSVRPACHCASQWLDILRGLEHRLGGASSDRQDLQHSAETVKYEPHHGARALHASALTG